MFKCWGSIADLPHKHYYLAHETVVRRESGSAMGPVSFAIFSFLNRDFEPGAGLFQNPAATG